MEQQPVQRELYRGDMIKFQESGSCILNHLNTFDMWLTYSNIKITAVVKSRCITLLNSAKGKKLFALDSNFNWAGKMI